LRSSSARIAALEAPSFVEDPRDLGGERVHVLAQLLPDQPAVEIAVPRLRRKL